MNYGDIEHRYFWEKPKQESACCMGGGPPMGGIKSFMIISKPMSMSEVNLLADVADIMTEKKGDKVFFEGLSYVKNTDNLYNKFWTDYMSDMSRSYGKEITAKFLLDETEYKFLKTYFEKTEREQIFLKDKFYTIKSWKPFDYNPLEKKNTFIITLSEVVK